MIGSHPHPERALSPTAWRSSGSFPLASTSLMTHLWIAYLWMVPCLVALLLLLPAISAWANDGNDEREEEFRREHPGPRTCSKIAYSTFNAGGHDIKDDFWIAYGNCINNASKRDAQGCIREVRAELREERSLCRQQKMARLNICELVGEDPYVPNIDPSQFLSPAAIAAAPNPYFPLVPGLVRILKSGDEIITVTVTNETKEILGVTCVVVRDVVEENGEIIEDTHDWYTQDMFGNVWYFGEISKNYEDGELANLDRSWKGGVEMPSRALL